MTNIKKDFIPPNGPILLLSAEGSTTADIAEADGVLDFSGNGNHGQAQSGVSVYLDSEKGDVFKFAGNCINGQHNINVSSDFSISFWFKYSSITSAQECIVSLGNNANIFIVNSSKKIYLFNASTNISTNLDIALSANSWNHFTFTSSNANEIKIYLNTELKTTNSDKLSSENVAYALGKRISGNTNFLSNSFISDFRIYPRVLSAAEIKYLYNGFQPSLIMGQTIPSGAILDLSARGLTTSGISQANGVVDRSGNGNHGQAYNGVAVVNDDEMGSCFSFDGTGYMDGSTSVAPTSMTFVFLFSYYFTDTQAQSCLINFNPSNRIGGLYLERSNQKIKFYNATSSGPGNYYTNTLFAQNTPYHIVAVSDAVNGLKLYVNGTLDAEYADVYLTHSTTFSYGIGNSTQTGGNKLKGKMSDIRIYPRALTASEVQQLANASLKKIRKISKGADSVKYIYYGNNLVYAKTANYEAVLPEVKFELHQINEATQPYPIVYTGKNASFSGITYSNSTPDLGQWEKWINAHFTPVMLRSNGTVDYELNRDNQNYKKDGTTASDVANLSYDGNAMLRIKKFYISCSTSTTGSGSSAYDVHTIKISDTKKDSSYTCWGFVDANGKEHDYVYYALYSCHKDSNNKLRSISGVTLNDSRPGNQLLSYSDTVAAAKANGTGWDISNLALENAIGLVIMMLYKSVNPTFINQEYVNLYKQSGSVYKVTGTRNADGGFPHVTAAQKQKALWIESFWRNYDPTVNQSRHWINGLASLRTGTGNNDFLPYYKKQPPYDDFTTISNWTPMSSTTPHAYMTDAVSHELRTVMFYDNIMFPKDDGVKRQGSITAATINRYFGGGEISGSTSTSLQYTDQLLPAQTGGSVMQDQYCSMPHYLGYSLVGLGINSYQKYGVGRLTFLGDPVFSRIQLSTSALGSNSRCVFISPAGNMFGTDWSGKCVKIFNSSGAYVRSFTPLSGKIPYAIAGDDTYLYVCYWDSTNIYKYQYSGTDTPTLISTWTAPVNQNDGAVVYGDYLYIVSQQKQIYKIHTSTGVITSLATSAYAINSICIDTKNSRIVTVHNGGLGQAEAPNNKAIIRIYSMSGSLLAEKTLDGEYVSAINGAQGVVVDKDGYIYLGGSYSIRAQYNQGLLVLNENLEVAYDISYTVCPTFCYSFCYDSYHNRIAWVGTGYGGTSPYIYAINI